MPAATRRLRPDGRPAPLRDPPHRASRWPRSRAQCSSAVPHPRAASEPPPRVSRARSTHTPGRRSRARRSTPARWSPLGDAQRIAAQQLGFVDRAGPRRYAALARNPPRRRRTAGSEPLRCASAIACSNSPSASSSSSANDSMWIAPRYVSGALGASAIRRPPSSARRASVTTSAAGAAIAGQAPRQLGCDQPAAVAVVVGVLAGDPQPLSDQRNERRVAACGADDQRLELETQIDVPPPKLLRGRKPDFDGRRARAGAEQQPAQQDRDLRPVARAAARRERGAERFDPGDIADHQLGAPGSSSRTSCASSPSGGSASARCRWAIAVDGDPRSLSRAAAVRSAATTRHGSLAGMLRSRCAATLPGSAPRPWSSTAARRCMDARRACGMSS